MTVELELLFDLKTRVDALRTIVATHLDALDRDLVHAIIEEKDRIRKGWTRTGVSGCVSPPLEISPEVESESLLQPVDASDSSAAIPEAVVDRIEAGGE